MEGSDEEGEPVTAAELAGLKVRHTADELMEGQVAILTLKDRGILDEHGELDDQMDELEEAAMVCGPLPSPLRIPLLPLPPPCPSFEKSPCMSQIGSAFFCPRACGTCCM